MAIWPNDKRRVAAIYDEAAGIYERVAAPRIHYLDSARAFLAENARSGRRILDVGCGTGYLTSDLPADVEVVGLDISPGMVEAARRRRPSGTYVVHDFHRPLPAGLGRFDAILASGAFDFCEDMPLVMGNLAAALAPGGRFYFTSNERRAGLPLHEQRWLETAGNELRIFFWTFSETASAIEAVGLRPVSYRHAPGWEHTPLQATIHYGYWVVQRPGEAAAGAPGG